ncbi:hypothetical protein PMAYCL1PPCAC_20008, partial [Pristionchus mayeri]
FKRQRTKITFIFSHSLTFRRSCGVCLSPDRRVRAVYTGCGHVVCLPCAKEQAIEAMSQCPFCSLVPRPDLLWRAGLCQGLLQPEFDGSGSERGRARPQEDHHHRGGEHQR